MIMKIQLKFILLITLLTFSVAEDQIKLEDIEHDNLLSERRVNRDQEIVKIGQSQRMSPPIHAGLQYEASKSASNDLGEDIVYAQPPPDSETTSAQQYVQQYENSEQKSSIQYVTPQQQQPQQQYETKPTSASYIHPVHEATHTYSSPARESLVKPIVYKPPASPSPYISQQPKYVYVQAGAQQISPSGIITYSQPQHSVENLLQTQQKNAQDDISYPVIEQNQISETSPQAAHAPTRQENYASRALQYFPYFTQTPSIPNYVMLFRNPAQAQTYAIPSIQYAQQVNMPADHVGPSQQLTAPQPTLTATFLNPNIESTAVLQAPEPTAPLQYATIPQLQLTQQSLHLQPIAEFVTSPQIQNAHQFYQSSPQHLQSPIDIFHSFQKHQPNSLLDSYVPSSVIYAAQRQRNAPFINRQILHAVSGNFALPTLGHPTHFFQHGSHQPGYNTIAYSTAQGYSKRSPKLVTERPLKLNKRN